LHYIELLSTVRSYRVVEGWSGKQNTLHDSVFTNTLKKMTAEGLLIRSEESGAFSRGVSYSLNPDAATVLDACQPVVAWLREHSFFVTLAQAYRGTTNDADSDRLPRSSGDRDADTDGGPTDSAEQGTARDDGRADNGTAAGSGPATPQPERDPATPD
jgi:DNA-binding HxlR family transcriptional regulator